MRGGGAEGGGRGTGERGGVYIRPPTMVAEWAARAQGAGPVLGGLCHDITAFRTSRT